MNPAVLFSHLAVACTAGKNFFSFPVWYQYLNCAKPDSPSIQNLGDIWLIAAALIRIILFVAGIVALVFVIYGSVTYITSQGQPDSTAKARDTIVNALIGMVIAIMSAAIVSFIAQRIK